MPGKNSQDVLRALEGSQLCPHACFLAQLLDLLRFQLRPILLLQVVDLLQFLREIAYPLLLICCACNKPSKRYPIAGYATPQCNLLLVLVIVIVIVLMKDIDMNIVKV